MPLHISSALSSSDVIIVVTQKEMIANVAPSDFATSDVGLIVGGVIPPLYDLAVETTRSAIAEDNIVPIREALQNYDVEARMKQALLSELRLISWLHVKQIHMLYDNYSEPEVRLLPKGSADALILINISCKLTSDFRLWPPMPI